MTPPPLCFWYEESLEDWVRDAENSTVRTDSAMAACRSFTPPHRMGVPRIASAGPLARSELERQHELTQPLPPTRSRMYRETLFTPQGEARQGLTMPSTVHDRCATECLASGSTNLPNAHHVG
jgi:hypothetical protein